jgi:hypothetical protein
VLLARLGGAAVSSTAQEEALSARFNRDQCLAAKSLNIKINPQYGRLDYSELDIVAAANTLSAPGGAAPSVAPSSAPQLSPPC